jgi:hypothetical protein
MLKNGFTKSIFNNTKKKYIFLKLKQTHPTFAQSVLDFYIAGRPLKIIMFVRVKCVIENNLSTYMFKCVGIRNIYNYIIKKIFMILYAI